MARSSDEPRRPARQASPAVPAPIGGVMHFLARQPRRRRVDDALGQPLYLLRTGQVVVPLARRGNAWECLVILSGAMSGQPAEGTGRVAASSIEIETALTVMILPTYDVDDPVDHVTIWLTRVWQRWPGGNQPRLAQALADLADPATMTVELTDEAVRRLLNQTHTRPVGLRRLLEQLEAAGLLSRVDDPAASPRPTAIRGRFGLTLPA
jgi:hypothetical protein